jgi:CRISPR-associated endonuclease/helicase Cas3
LIEALEIESATCILACDREKYISSTWDKRIPLEIPVNYHTIVKFKSQYEQLEVGAYPFVVPQDESEHLLFGLELAEPDKFL